MEIFWVPFATVLAIPGRWGLRIGVAAVLLAADRVYLTPATPWEELQGFDSLGAVVVAIFLLAVFSGVAVRIAIDLLRAQPIICRGNRWLGWTDLLLSAAGGGLVGTVATLSLAVVLRGQTGGLALHLGLSAVAAGSAAAFLVWSRGLFRPFLTMASATIAVLVLLGGVRHPAWIEAEALRLHAEYPRCLRTPDQRPPTADELRLLTLPKAPHFIAGLTLTVMLPRGPQHFRWSYRSLRFRTYNSYAHSACPSAPALP